MSLYSVAGIQAAIADGRPIILLGTAREAEQFSGITRMAVTAPLSGWSAALASYFAGGIVIVAACGLRPVLAGVVVDELLSAGAERAKFVRVRDLKPDEIVAAANRVAWRWRVPPPRTLLLRAGTDEWAIASPLNRDELVELAALIATELRA